MTAPCISPKRGFRVELFFVGPRSLIDCELFALIDTVGRVTLLGLFKAAEPIAPFSFVCFLLCEGRVDLTDWSRLNAVPAPDPFTSAKGRTLEDIGLFAAELGAVDGVLDPAFLGNGGISSGVLLNLLTKSCRDDWRVLAG